MLSAEKSKKALESKDIVSEVVFDLRLEGIPSGGIKKVSPPRTAGIKSKEDLLDELSKTLFRMWCDQLKTQSANSNIE
jgi:hypothetical protein